MNGVDFGKLELLKRSLKARSLLRITVFSTALDLRPKPQFHLSSSLFGEGHGHDSVERGQPFADQGDNSADEYRRLAGSGRRFDKEGGAEVGKDALPCLGIGQVVHGSSRSMKSDSRFSSGLRAVRRSS